MSVKLSKKPLPNIPDEFKVLTEDEAKRQGLDVGSVPMGNLGPILDRLFWEIAELRRETDPHR